MAHVPARNRGEREEASERGKLDKAVVLYFPPNQIGEDKGSCCGKCMMFVKDHCTVVAGPINGNTGVCGLYVHGKHGGPDMKGMMPKKVAGYIDGTDNDGFGGQDGQAPTHCGNCEYYQGGEMASGACQLVRGTVGFHGCCNAWEGKD